MKRPQKVAVRFAELEAIGGVDSCGRNVHWDTDETHEYGRLVTRHVQLA